MDYMQPWIIRLPSTEALVICILNTIDIIMFLPDVKRDGSSYMSNLNLKCLTWPSRPSTVYPAFYCLFLFI